MLYHYTASNRTPNLSSQARMRGCISLATLALAEPHHRLPGHATKARSAAARYTAGA